jgi:probable phosphoglycerate mutase
MLRYECPSHDICPIEISSALNCPKCEGNVTGGSWKGDDAPSPLTEAGRHQAELLGKNWKDTRIDHLVSSPLSRAHDTAKALSDHNEGHPEVVLNSLLVERRYGSVVPRLMRDDYAADP